jgi:hypothetical protein
MEYLFREPNEALVNWLTVMVLCSIWIMVLISFSFLGWAGWESEMEFFSIWGKNGESCVWRLASLYGEYMRWFGKSVVPYPFILYSLMDVCFVHHISVVLFILALQNMCLSWCLTKKNPVLHSKDPFIFSICFCPHESPTIYLKL